MPHERQAFLDRMGTEEAAIEPPRFEALGATRVGGGLSDDVGELLEIWRDAFQARFAVEQTRYGRLRAISQIALDLGPCPAECRAAMQMHNPLQIPGGGI